MDGSTAFVLRRHHPRNFTPDVSALDHISSSEAKPDDKLVQDAGNVLDAEITFERWRRRERVSW
jgi:hypothetical protein